MKAFRLLLALALAAAALPAAAQEFVFGINEGVTYRITPHETRERYRELGEMLSKALKRPVKLVPVDQYPVLQKNYEAKAYDLAYIHPTHHALRAMRDSGYKLVAVTKGYTDYKASFLTKPDAPYKQPQDVLKTKMVMPDPDSITAWMVRATLRDLGADPAKVSLGTTRYQDGIPFMMENGFYEVGITAANAVVKDWQSKGGKVLFQSKPVPIKILVASPNVSAAEIEKIREVFLSLEGSKEGQAILDKLKFKGYQPGDDKLMAELAKWLGI
ncbi:MAG: phosphate/phosphite/phosphonate ABC transporter substrate-binding protein [Burkholderiales bacterium]|nr:phosphate/phosphite/phosphonate ABC transporter substrate-binding protein [Burkholderiales bacterium]